jgi:hypothetical protein
MDHTLFSTQNPPLADAHKMEKDYLILKRASASRPSGEWNDDDYDVLADGVVVGRIFSRRGTIFRCRLVAQQEGTLHDLWQDARCLALPQGHRDGCAR